MIAEPPSDAGRVHDTDTRLLPDTPTTPVGEPGTAAGVPGVTGVTGVTVADWFEVWPIPTPFVAVTVNVYGVPFVNPVTVHVKAPVVIHVLVSGNDVTV